MLKPSSPKWWFWRLGFEEVIRFRWGHEVGPHGEISVLIRKRRKTRALSLHHVRTQREGSVCKPGRRHSLGNWNVWPFNLKLPSSHTVRNTFLLINHSIYGILFWQPELTKIPALQVIAVDFKQIARYFPSKMSLFRNNEELQFRICSWSNGKPHLSPEKQRDTLCL